MTPGKRSEARGGVISTLSNVRLGGLTKIKREFLRARLIKVNRHGPSVPKVIAEEHDLQTLDGACLCFVLGGVSVVP